VLIQSAAFVLAFLFAPGSGVLRTRSGNETGNA
jgi:hypothetical protein